MNIFFKNKGILLIIGLLILCTVSMVSCSLVEEPEPEEEPSPYRKCGEVSDPVVIQQWRNHFKCL